jgi:parallel beta-helix repeat protein
MTLPDPSPPDKLFIIGNHIQSNRDGISISDNHINAVIEGNNFIDNTLSNVGFNILLPSEHLKVPAWNHNYWDNHKGVGPKIIVGRLSRPYTFFMFPWITFDFYPAGEPFDIQC